MTGITLTPAEGRGAFYVGYRRWHPLKLKRVGTIKRRRGKLRLEIRTGLAATLALVFWHEELVTLLLLLRSVRTSRVKNICVRPSAVCSTARCRMIVSRTTGIRSFKVGSARAAATNFGRKRIFEPLVDRRISTCQSHPGPALSDRLLGHKILQNARVPARQNTTRMTGVRTHSDGPMEYYTIIVSLLGELCKVFASLMELSAMGRNEEFRLAFGA